MVHSNMDEWRLSEDATHSIYTQPLETPANDERQYRLIRLNNQLEALVISDPDTDRASAALDVNVGNLCDPVSLIFDLKKTNKHKQTNNKIKNE